MAMNPIEYLVSLGWRVTSNPHTYASGVFGLRRYHENRKHLDEYCNGYHNAWDLGKWDGAPVPSIADGVVGYGTRENGTFGGQVLVIYEQLGIQVIYGHVKRPLKVKVGQKVKKGETIAYQGSTNNQGVRMSSHLHIQFQPIKEMNEWEFTCVGIDALKIDIGGKPKSSAKTVTVKAGDTLWGLSQTHKTTVKKIKQLNNLDSDTIHPGQVLKITGDAIPRNEDTKQPKPKKPAKKFNKYQNRGRREHPAHFKGTVEIAEVRKRKGSQKTGFNWNEKAGYDIATGETVFVYEVHNKWARIYVGRLTGKGSNDWIHMDRVTVTQVFD